MSSLSIPARSIAIFAALTPITDVVSPAFGTTQRRSCIPVRS